MTDIVDWLRGDHGLASDEMICEAADEIERLRDDLKHSDEVRQSALQSLLAAENEIERLRKQLEMSEKRFAALKEAYDKNRRRNIQLYGSNKIDGAGIPWVPKKQDEPEALEEKE